MLLYELIIFIKQLFNDTQKEIKKFGGFNQLLLLFSFARILKLKPTVCINFLITIFIIYKYVKSVFWIFVSV